jgi:hypothetical protein
MIKFNGLSAAISASILSASALAAAEPSTAGQNKSRIIEEVLVTAQKKTEGPSGCSRISIQF